MALPSNWLPAAPRRSAPRALPILFFTLFGATATVFYLLLRVGTLRPPALIFWKSSNPDTRFFLVVSAPYLLSILLPFIPNSCTRPLASGIACPTAAVFTYWEVLLLADLLITLIFEGSPSMRRPRPLPAR